MTRHVVVVDDAETNAQILSAIVEGLPDTVAHDFTSSQEALRFAAETHVDAFVLDYHMPAPDGLEMTTRLRADFRYTFVPIVIVTAEHEREHRVEALLRGANDYIERPVEPRELQARLETLLSLHAARTRLSENVSTLEDSLRAEERRSRAQADRMIALWRLVSNAELSLDDVVNAILQEGARAIRYGQTFYGTLSRIEDDEIVVEAAARNTRIIPHASEVGSRLKLSEALQGLVVQRRRTCFWSDIASDPEARSRRRIELVGMRAAIGTLFSAGRAEYVLTFWSQSPLGEPFTLDETTYVELLAGFFAARLQQAWQSERITHQLSHDALTGLRNRTQFRVDARMAFAKTLRSAVAIIDLADFRHINEAFGHIIGDALLVEVSAALDQRAGDGDIVARLAGDTFGAFLPDIGDHSDALQRILAFTAVFDRPFSTGDRDGKQFIPLLARTGIAIGGPGEGVSFDTLLARADTALFAAKRNRGSIVAVYEPGMESPQTLRDRFASELARAIDEREFELYFQPHIDIDTMRVTGAEALIRWHHPTRGLLQPAEFIPFAEKHGLITTISRWVLASSLAAAECLCAIDPGFRVFFNLSAHDFSDTTLVEAVRAALERGAPVQNMGIELTETAAMADFAATAQALTALRECGVLVALDDFGIGYSSLSMLKRLPVDVVKIDRAFISEVLTDDGAGAIVDAVIRFGGHFGFRTLGEGVELEEQLAWLRAHDCHLAQGYAIARPAPLDEMIDWLQRRSSMAVNAPVLSSAVRSPGSSPR